MMSSSASQTYLFQQDYSEWPVYTLPHYSEWLSQVISEQPLLNLDSLAAYWLWDFQSQLCSAIWVWNDQTQKQNVKESSFKYDKHNIDETHLNKKIDELYELLNYFTWDPSTILIHSKKKSERKANSKRRSNFIGVSRNGPNWQSMISIQKKKAYIGTYQTEKEAAVSFDFYSIMTHGVEAKTNFSYSKDMIIEMIIKYKAREDKCYPTVSFY